MAGLLNRPVQAILPEPQRKAFGTPDFVIKGHNTVIGYVEAKSIGDSLDSVLESEQLLRYLQALPTLLVTNHLEFRLFEDGTQVDRVAVTGRVQLMQGSPPDGERVEEIRDLFDRLYRRSTPEIADPRSLAKALARRARLLYRAAAETLSEQAESHGDLPALYSAYKTHLMEDLTPDQFADLYAQALTYGLFLARMHHDEASGSFTRRRAYDLLPRSVALIKNLFRYLELSDEQFPVSLRWIVDDLAALLDNINLEGVLRRYAQHGEEHDPVFYFYETFLSEYRPDEREQRGVYYTPEPVVSYIVRSVDKLLRRDFGKRDGLATQEGVTLLDPAVGTGTFLAHSFVQVRDDLLPTSAGIFPDVIRNHALRNFAGFELLAAPYVIAHLKLTNVLAQLGYEIGESERLGVYLTNHAGGP